MRAPLDPSGDWHAEAIRAIAFDPSGRFLATAGDDKAVRLFAKTDEPAYECVRRWHDRKKVRSFFFISTRAIILTSCLFAINSHPRSRSTTPERT
jgi:WD40 repeat protein